MKVIDQSDLELIKTGDLTPLKRIFEQNYQYCIHNLVKISSCSTIDAKDMTMDAILVLRNKILSNEYKNTNVRSFLLTVAQNKLRNKQKRDSRFMDYDPIFLEEHLSERDDHPEKDELQNRLLEIYKGIKLLNEPCKSILELNLLEGFSLEVVYQKLGYKSKGVLKTTKTRCIKKLREKLIKCHHE